MATGTGKTYTAFQIIWRLWKAGVKKRILFLADRNLVLKRRTSLVADLVTEYLAEIGPHSKTIVFCEDIDHASRMRTELVNANKDLVTEDSRYVVQITGDNPQGKAQLDYFIEPAEPYSVIATTSKLLSTGVDAKTCKLIILDQTIQSMTEFKQIIGRGTRIKEEYGKLYFTIMDFRGVTDLFADPTFDGEPVVIYQPQPGDPIVPPEDEGERDSGDEEGDIDVVGPASPPDVGVDSEPEPPPRKYYVGDVTVCWTSTPTVASPTWRTARYWSSSPLAASAPSPHHPRTVRRQGCLLAGHPRIGAGALSGIIQLAESPAIFALQRALIR
jgi:hypothetical protein